MTIVKVKELKELLVEYKDDQDVEFHFDDNGDVKLVIGTEVIYWEAK